MHKRLKELMADVFQTEVDAIPDDAEAGAIEGWDSLGHIELMLALEGEYGVHIATETMLELLSLEAIEEFLQRKSAAEAT